MTQEEKAIKSAEFYKEIKELCKEMSSGTNGAYNPGRLLGMLSCGDAVRVAKELINSDKLSEGFVSLWTLGRLDLTIEAFVYVRKEYHPLFLDFEIKKAKERLVDAQKGNYKGVKVV